MHYAKIVVRMGVRTECKNCDFSDILEDEDVSTLAFFSPSLVHERDRCDPLKSSEILLHRCTGEAANFRRVSMFLCVASKCDRALRRNEQGRVYISV